MHRYALFRRFFAIKGREKKRKFLSIILQEKVVIELM